MPPIDGGNSGQPNPTVFRPGPANTACNGHGGVTNISPCNVAQDRWTSTVEMKAPFPRTLIPFLRSLGFLAVLFCFVPSLHASPVIFPGRIQNNLLAVYVAIALFLESVCVAWLLRRVRHPRLFVFWILGANLLTFPVFLGAVWLLSPSFATLPSPWRKDWSFWERDGWFSKFAGARLSRFT